MINGIQVRDRFKCLAQITILGLFASTVMAQGAGNRLEDIRAQALPGNKVELSLVLSGPAPEPRIDAARSPSERSEGSTIPR